MLNKAGSEDRREDERQRRGRRRDLRGDVPSGAAPSFDGETKVDRDLARHLTRGAALMTDRPVSAVHYT